jgi:hypothetical protein
MRRDTVRNVPRQKRKVHIAGGAALTKIPIALAVRRYDASLMCRIGRSPDSRTPITQRGGGPNGLHFHPGGVEPAIRDTVEAPAELSGMGLDRAEGVWPSLLRRWLLWAVRSNVACHQLSKQRRGVRGEVRVRWKREISGSVRYVRRLGHVDRLLARANHGNGRHPGRTFASCPDSTLVRRCSQFDTWLASNDPRFRQLDRRLPRRLP